MLVQRLASWTLLAVGGFALLAARQPATAQPGGDLPKSPPNITGFRDNAGADLNKAKAAFTTFAKYQADIISHPKIYSVPQEFVAPKGPLIPTTETIIKDLSGFIITPTPESKIGADQADYIRELGNALDTELKIVIERSSVPVVRVNAMRLLAAACKSGAQVHWPTVTGLITNANTPAEVKYYAFQAAGNLLSAYDFNDYQSRKHAHKPKDVSDLVAALQGAITKPGMILPAPAPGTQLSEEQVDVLKFIRRGAIRALGQCRFSDKVPGGPEQYPGFTLAQVATADPAIIPPPSETEVAESVIGLCNMAPPSKSAEKEPYAYAMADAMLTGITNFATRRAAAPLDKTLAWRSYGARLSDGLKSWKPLFDPAFNPANPKVYSTASVPKVVEDIVTEAESRVLAPMYENNNTVNVNALRGWRDNTLRGDKKWTLSPFVSDPKLVLQKK